MGVPRRIRTDLQTPIEKAISDVIQLIEESGADVRLTDAQNLLGEARDKVSDYIDEQLKGTEL